MHGKPTSHPLVAGSSPPGGAGLRSVAHRPRLGAAWHHRMTGAKWYIWAIKIPSPLAYSSLGDVSATTRSRPAAAGGGCHHVGARRGRRARALGNVHMRKIVMSVVVALASTVGLGVLSPAAHAASAGLTDPQTGRIVSEEPSSLAPNILDGTVYSMTKVGNWIVVGGSFTQAENYNSSTVLTRNHVLAFDATTGKISTTFVPEPNGTVFKVQTAGDGTSVYLGGHFSSVAGVAMKYLARLDLATGAVTTGFKPSNFDGDIRDLEVVGSRLWVGGKFTHIGGTAQKALGTVTAAKGVY